MAAVTGKRKRENGTIGHVQFKKAATAAQPGEAEIRHVPHPPKSTQHLEDARQTQPSTDSVSFQIVTGSYERVLHGICASIPSNLIQRSTISEPPGSSGSNDGVLFSDTFLFAAHSSSIRCLALSPPTDSGKRILATGSTDERINLYQLSTAPAPTQGKSLISLPDDTPTAVNSRNRSLGNLIHHERAVTRLHFPTKSKLFSAAEDNTVAISRARDWTVLSSIKAPIPNPQGRPSGDTAGPGEVPAGINDFAIHPSQKLMLSVGRGERCMRLWNLMTGKKAGVLNFERDLLAQVGEGKHSSGEGRRVLWNEKGEAFVIAFERGIALFGIDSKPKAVIRPTPPTKIHQIKFIPSTATPVTGEDVLAVSTEDGRVLFFDTSFGQDQPATQELPPCKCIGQLGGPSTGVSGRVKDFDTVALSNSDNENLLLLVLGSSDGAVRLWTVYASEFAQDLETTNHDQVAETATNGTGLKVPQVGRVIGTMETVNRITCLGAFVMDGKQEPMLEEEPLNRDENGDGNVEGSSSDSED